ncbi:MAG: hypothetical protein IKP10_06880 [Clostridia bacterium]|nr:hypothetical protein [Clostridia bacterium]
MKNKEYSTPEWLDPIKELRGERFHAMNFIYKGKEYSFAGWWVLEWEDGDKEYDTINEFLKDPFFDGRTFEEVLPDIKAISVDVEP